MDMPVLGEFDLWMSTYFLTLRSPTLDGLTHFVLASELRIGVLAALLFYLWMVPEGTARLNVAFITRSIAGIVFAMVGVFIARHLAPPQSRPRLGLTMLDFPPLDGLGHLADFHSFPSDTATLAAAITAIIFIGSRHLGWLALAWTLFAVSFPRIYVGYHYFSDIVAGLLLGASVALLVAKVPFAGLSRWSGWVQQRYQTHPAAIVLVLALLANQIGEMFPVLQYLGAASRSYWEGSELSVSH